jgi:hypothetical protein
LPDPSDGGWIEKGRTFVSHEADVFRLHPERFEVRASMVRSLESGLPSRWSIAHGTSSR